MRTVDSAVRVCCTATLVLLVVGCGSGPVIGVLLPMSGPLAPYGESMKSGIELGVEIARQDGTLPPGLTLAWGDTAGDPDTAVAEFERLVHGAHANLVIPGTTSDELERLLPLFEERRVIGLTPSATAPELTRKSRFIFRVFPSDDLEGRRAGRFLGEERDAETIVLFTGSSAHDRGIEPSFRQMYEEVLDGTVVGTVEVGASDWREQASRILDTRAPMGAYVIGYIDQVLDVLAFLRERQFQGAVCTTSAFNAGERIRQRADLSENVFFPQPAFETDDTREVVRVFVSHYQTQHGHVPDIYAAHAYDAIRVAMAAITATGNLQVEELRKTLQFKLGEFPGVTGVIQFNDHGDVHRNPIMFVVKDGSVHNYERYLKEEKERIRKSIRDILVG